MSDIEGLKEQIRDEIDSLGKFGLLSTVELLCDSLTIITTLQSKLAEAERALGEIENETRYVGNSYAASAWRISHIALASIRNDTSNTEGEG